jgi:cytochrome c biogenesis protein CcmG/thiol:disulfide interchange protein DsbE
VASAFQGSPPALAALHAQPNQLLGGGVPAFDARLKALRGYPVVVNEWASWCGPCQSEFPTYQRVSVTYGRKVAFIGLDAKDADQAAGSFLRKFPVSYPSYVDRSGGIASWLHAFTAYPQTFYFDARGKMVYDKAGPYLSVQALKRDIRQYLHA